MGIQTDSTPLEDSKNPDTCNLFALYKLLASPSEILEMRKNYEAGGYGYGHAKQAFYELVLTIYSEQRSRYNYYMENLNEVDKALEIGASKAKNVADIVLKRVRTKVGY